MRDVERQRTAGETHQEAAAKAHHLCFVDCRLHVNSPQSFESLFKFIFSHCLRERGETP